jgi:hypothetical protein
MPLREIIAVHSGNNMKPINTVCGGNTTSLNVKAGGTQDLSAKYEPVKNW